MNRNWQKTHRETSSPEGKGEARKAPERGAELFIAERDCESSKGTDKLMEEVCRNKNMLEALRRIRANKGTAGADDMTVEQLAHYLQTHWSEVREQLLTGSYKPKPVKRVEIPKPDGAKRQLGIPTVLDRFTQQAILQILQRYWEPGFSEHSYGFRPGRTMRQAISKAQGYIQEGYTHIVDIDLEKFFDRVNHDMLMSAIAQRVKDKRLLKLLRRLLTSGVVMENGPVEAREEGTPQGGPLSPFLSNIFLDKLDKELEARGHRFVRYADDCNIYVQSKRAAERVMESIRGFIETKLKLRVNRTKSAVSRPSKRKFLGFSFTAGTRNPKRRIAPESIRRFKMTVKWKTRRKSGRSIADVVKELNPYLRGWLNHYGYCQTPTVLENLEGWMRRRLRSIVWKQWKRGKRRYKELVKRGINATDAAKIAGSSHGPWRLSRTVAMNVAFPKEYFRRLGLRPLVILET